ncbi:MAG: glycerophosphodiester phosphodiesterase [Actinobacteria bacterium]|nr:glycerophosphodiester phosphodiesterase [Actinomycetota bacterium]
MRILRGDGPPIRIGHRGAAALAPENTLEALRAGIARGCDYVEFDVLSTSDGCLVLAHSAHELPEDAASFDDALTLLAAEGVGAHVDLKQRGLEEGVGAALRSYDLLERSLVSSLDWAALRDLRRYEPALRVGLSYPEDRYGLSGRRTFAPLLAGGLAAMKRTLPRLIGRWLQRAAASAAVVHRQLVTPSLIRACHDRGAAVWVWTVNDPAEAGQLAEWGADAIISDDPRILGPSKPSTR